MSTTYVPGLTDYCIEVLNDDLSDSIESVMLDGLQTVNAIDELENDDLTLEVSEYINNPVDNRKDFKNGDQTIRITRLTRN